MASIHFDFFPLTLQMNWSAEIILPKHIQSDEELPLVYLLHDDGEGCTIWNRMAGIERLSDKCHVAFAIPEAAQGLYTDMKDGYTFFTFLKDEFPKILHDNFNLLTKDFSKTLLIGKGTGGYAALKWALNAEKAPAAVLALDAVLQIEAWYRQIETNEPDRLYRLINAWGENASYQPEENRLDCITRRSAGEKIPFHGFRSSGNPCVCPDEFLAALGKNFAITPHTCEETEPWFNAAGMIAFGISFYLVQEEDHVTRQY